MRIRHLPRTAIALLTGSNLIKIAHVDGPGAARDHAQLVLDECLTVPRVLQSSAEKMASMLDSKILAMANAKGRLGS